MDSLFEIKPDGTNPRDADDVLIAAYVAAGRTLDDLPYTPEFESILRAIGASEGDRAGVFHRLHNLRKAHRLPRLGRAATRSIKVSPSEESVLVELVRTAVGSLGQRDQLLYDPRFDALVQHFNARSGRNLDQHDAWRLVAKLAK